MYVLYIETGFSHCTSKWENVITKVIFSFHCFDKMYHNIILKFTVNRFVELIRFKWPDASNNLAEYSLSHPNIPSEVLP